MAQRIIVCSSEQHAVRAISLKFTRAGFDVKAASDVEACWTMLHRNEPPSLLILDSQLPSVPNALELVRRMNLDVQLVNLPIVILTAKRMELDEQMHLLMTHGIDQIIDKPFSPRHLLAVVNRLIVDDSDSGAPAFESINQRESVEVV